MTIMCFTWSVRTFRRRRRRRSTSGSTPGARTIGSWSWGQVPGWLMNTIALRQHLTVLPAWSPAAAPQSVMYLLVTTQSAITILQPPLTLPPSRSPILRFILRKGDEYPGPLSDALSSFRRGRSELDRSGLHDGRSGQPGRVRDQEIHRQRGFELCHGVRFLSQLAVLRFARFQLYEPASAGPEHHGSRDCDNAGDSAKPTADRAYL